MISRRLIRTRALQDLYSFILKRKVKFQDKLSVYFKDKSHFNFLENLKKSSNQRGSVESTMLLGEKSNRVTNEQTPNQKDQEIPGKENLQPEQLESIIENFKDSVRRYEKETLGGINELENQISRLTALVIEILIKWYHISTSKTETDKLLIKNKVPVILSDNFSKIPFLEYLAKDKSIEDFLSKNLTGDIDQGLLNDWYNNILRVYKPFKEYSIIRDPQSKDEYKFIETIIKRILFGEKKILDYFEAKEPNLSVILEPSKVFLLDILRDFLDNKEKNSKFIFEDIEIINKGDREFYNTLVTGVLKHEENIVSEINLHLKNWEIERVLVIDFVILLLGVYEILYMSDIPSLVSLDEYIEISKEYSTEKSKIFINGVLHSLTLKKKNQDEKEK